MKSLLNRCINGNGDCVSVRDKGLQDIKIDSIIIFKKFLLKNNIISYLIKIAEMI